MQISGKTVLIAPLNWGLGHATRCMVIINKLLSLNCKVIVASDGVALGFLKNEFPDLTFLNLPSYNISYSKNPIFFKIKLASQIWTIYKAMQQERKLVANWINLYGIDLIISDNRFGVFSKSIPSIYITHQLKVMSGFTTWLTSKIHQQIIKKYTYCWVPDLPSDNSLGGELSESNAVKSIKIGPLTRLNKIDCPEVIDVLFLVSGPEPQRTILEQKFVNEIKKNTDLRIVLVCGNFQSEQKITTDNLVNIYNYANSGQINQLINASKLVVCRSGYSTIMDLCVLQKKALLIPTPGQDEQEYLAKYLSKKQYLPYVNQSDFNFDSINLVKNFKGLPFNEPLNDDLFLELFTHF